MPSAPSSALNATDADGGEPDGPEDISGDATTTSATSTTTASNDDGNNDDGNNDDGQKEDDCGDDDDGGGGGNGGDAGTEVTLCRAPTLACLGRACGKAGSEISVLWEGFACRAAAALNVSFACRIGGLEVPAVTLGGSSSSSSAGAGLDWDWNGVDGRDREEAWGPDWVGAGRGAAGGGGLVCEVPRLEWAEEGKEPAVMVPVEVVWFSMGQVCAFGVCVCVLVAMLAGSGESVFLRQYGSLGGLVFWSISAFVHILVPPAIRKPSGVRLRILYFESWRFSRIYAASLLPPGHVESIGVPDAPSTHHLFAVGHPPSKQASANAQRQVRQGATDVAVRGLSVMGDAAFVNSHVLTFR